MTIVVSPGPLRQFVETVAGPNSRWAAYPKVKQLLSVEETCLCCGIHYSQRQLPPVSLPERDEAASPVPARSSEVSEPRQQHSARLPAGRNL